MKLKLNFMDLLETAYPTKISVASGMDIIAFVTSLLLGMIANENYIIS